VRVDLYWGGRYCLKCRPVYRLPQSLRVFCYFVESVLSNARITSWNTGASSYDAVDACIYRLTMRAIILWFLCMPLWRAQGTSTPYQCVLLAVIYVIISAVRIRFLLWIIAIEVLLHLRMPRVCPGRMNHSIYTPATNRHRFQTPRLCNNEAISRNLSLMSRRLVSEMAVKLLSQCCSPFQFF
jgi:hypothetical protein